MGAVTKLRKPPLTRGALARRVGCNAETVRYYERIGLMADPPRSAGGHRLYRQEDLDRLVFICRARALGFTVAAIRELLAMVDGGGQSCADIKTMTLRHAADIRHRIADLQTIAGVLEGMAARCDDGDVPNCPVIEALAAAEQTPL